MGVLFPCNLGLTSFIPNFNKPDIIIIIIRQELLRVVACRAARLRLT